MHASHVMCTAVCVFILGGCRVGTSYHCAAGIESALGCASLPFGDLKLEISSRQMCASGVDCELALLWYAPSKSSIGSNELPGVCVGAY